MTKILTLKQQPTLNASSVQPCVISSPIISVIVDPAVAHAVVAPSAVSAVTPSAVAVTVAADAGASVLAHAAANRMENGRIAFVATAWNTTGGATKFQAKPTFWACTKTLTETSYAKKRPLSWSGDPNG